MQSSEAVNSPQGIEVEYDGKRNQFIIIDDVIIIIIHCRLYLVELVVICGVN